MNKLFIDLKEDCNGYITGRIRLPADGSFTFEALLLVMEEFGKSVNKPTEEVISDLYNYARSKKE